MVEGSIPIPYRRVIFAKGHFEIVVVVITDNGTFELQVVTCGPSRERDLTEVAHLFRKRRGEVEIKLAEVKTADRTFLVR